MKALPLTQEEKQYVAKIGGYIRAVRQQFGMTKEGMARILNVDVETITALENGEGNPAQATRLYLKVKQLRQR